MFLWNMLGALVMLPALAHFLLKPSPARAIEAEAFGELQPPVLMRVTYVPTSFSPD